MCLELRDQLKKCTDCEAFICVPCLNKYKEHLCPHCRAKPFSSEKLNKFEQNHLDRLTFKCNECSNTFAFKERRKHMQNCGISASIFPCSRLIQTCKCCTPVIVRSDNYFCQKKAISQIELLKKIDDEHIRIFSTELDILKIRVENQ